MRIRLNLASGDHRRRRWIRWVLLALSLVCLGTLIGEGVLYRQMRSDASLFEDRIRRIDLQEQKVQGEIRGMGMEPNEESFKELRKKVAFANDLIYQKTFSWTQFLSDLETRVPPEVAVNRIQPTFSTGLVNVAGVAKSLKELTKLMIQLASDPAFQDVFLLDQKVDPKSPVKDAVGFSIQFRYRIDRPSGKTERSKVPAKPGKGQEE